MDQTVTRIEVELPANVLEAVDAWIARHEDPKPTRSDAITQLVNARLGGEMPSTIMPGFVTGRDIV